MSRIFYFEIHQAPSELLLSSAKKICPERLNCPGKKDFSPLIERVLAGVNSAMVAKLFSSYEEKLQ